MRPASVIDLVGVLDRPFHLHRRHVRGRLPGDGAERLQVRLELVLGRLAGVVVPRFRDPHHDELLAHSPDPLAHHPHGLPGQGDVRTEFAQLQGALELRDAVGEPLGGPARRGGPQFQVAGLDQFADLLGVGVAQELGQFALREGALCAGQPGGPGHLRTQQVDHAAVGGPAAAGQVPDGVEPQAVAAHARDRPEQVEVGLVVVHLLAAPSGLGQQPAGLVVADGPARQARGRGQFGQRVGPRFSHHRAPP